MRTARVYLRHVLIASVGLGVLTAQNETARSVLVFAACLTIIANAIDAAFFLTYSFGQSLRKAAERNAERDDDETEDSANWWKDRSDDFEESPLAVYNREKAKEAIEKQSHTVDVYGGNGWRKRAAVITLVASFTPIAAAGYVFVAIAGALAGVIRVASILHAAQFADVDETGR